MAAIVGAVILLICVFAYREFRQGLRQRVDAMLLSQAKAVAASIVSDDSPVEARREMVAFLSQAVWSGMPIYTIWYDGTDEHYLRSHGEEDWPLEWRPRPEIAPPVSEHRFFDAEAEGDPYRLLWVRRLDRELSGNIHKPLNVVIAAYDGLTLEQVQDFLGVLVCLGVGTIVLTVLVMVPVLGWALRPVSQMTARMDEFTGANIHSGAPTDVQAPAELKPFTQAWNRMIERLALAARQQRRFTADASHEMRTPLAILKSTFQTVRSRRRDAETYEAAIDRSLEDLERLEHLTSQLLVLAHLDDIQDKDGQYSIRVEELVSDICEQFVPLVECADGRLVWHPCPAVVKGDADQLRCLLGNLIDNALKYGPRGGQIVVSMRCLDNWVEVTVHDDGGAIPFKEIDRVFDRFYRIRNDRTSSETGSGLGLAIAREIAEKHAGKVSLRSDLGQGTDFIVSLPCSRTQ